MPSENPQPERVDGLSDAERLDAYVRPVIATALLECAKAGWLSLDEAKSPVERHHDLQDTAATVLRRLQRAGLHVTPVEGPDSVL